MANGSGRRRWHERVGFVLHARITVVRIENGAREVLQKVGAAQAKRRPGCIVREMPAYAFRLICKEKRRAANGLKEHRVMDRPAGLCRIGVFGIDVKPASLRAGSERCRFMWVVVPAL